MLQWFGKVAVVNASLPVVSDRYSFGDGRGLGGPAASDGVRLGVPVQQSAAVWGESFQVMRIAGPAGTLVIEEGSMTITNRSGNEELVLEPSPVQVSVSADRRHQFTRLELGPAVLQAKAFPPADRRRRDRE